MYKKTYLYSLLIIPIILFIYLTILFFTEIWKPNKPAIIIITLLLVIVSIFAFYFIKNSYYQFNDNDVENNNFTYNIKQRYWKLGLIGFITDFFDTIGIGSFATSITLLKLTRQVRNDKKIMGILNVGHTIPSCIEAILFIALIPVEWGTLLSLIIAGTIGAHLGAILANKIKLNWSKLFIGITLLIISLIMLLGHKHVGIMPSAGSNNGFDIWWKYLIGIFAFFILGILMALGIGIFAPAMAIMYLFGLSQESVFPIMTGTAAFLTPIAGIRFIKDKNYEIKPALAFSLCGTIGVICSYTFFFIFLKKGLGLDKEQFINILLWLVIIVICYTSISLITTAIKNLRYYYQGKTKQIRY